MEDLHLVTFEAEVLLQLGLEPVEGGDALGEDDGAHGRCGADADLVAQIADQGLVLRRGGHGGVVEDGQAAQSLGLAVGGGRVVEALDAVVEGVAERGGRGQEGLGQRPREEGAVGAGVGRGGRRAEPGVDQFVDDGVLLRGGVDEAVVGLEALGPVCAHLLGHLGAVAVSSDGELLDALGVEVAVGLDGGGVEEADQLGERLARPVVRGGGGEDEGVGLRREDAGQAVVEGGGVGDVVRLVDDDGVPVVAAQVVDEALLLQRVDGDDDAAEVGERVAVGGQLLLDAGHALGVEAHERDGEAAPHLVLHLLQHVSRGDDQDPLPAAAADELGEDHADLERLAEADGVGEEDAGPQCRGVEGLGDGLVLVAELAGEHAGRDGERVVAEGDGGLAEGGLHPEAGAAVLG